MTYYEARIIECQARIGAINARIKGYIAFNTIEIARGGTSCYGEEVFFKAEAELNAVGNEIRQLAEMLK